MTTLDSLRFAKLTPDAATDKFAEMKYEAFFERNPAVCGGQMVIRGARVPVRTLLGSLAEGDDMESILTAFPSVSREALRAVIAFAAASAEEGIPLNCHPALA